jgi:hypothetical protein
MLLVIVMEVLGRIIFAVVSGGLLFGFSLRTWINISYILFADDTLICSRVDLDHLRHVQCFFIFIFNVLKLSRA